MLTAVVSSRIGLDVRRHRRIATLLCYAAMDAHRRSATWLVARGSAIEPWAERAAERFDIPVQWLVTSSRQSDRGDVCYAARKTDRDSAVVRLADRVDGLYVRRGGKIHDAIAARLRRRADGDVRVAYWPSDQTATKALVSAGAVGWFLSGETTVPPDDTSLSGAAVVTPPPGDWLVHCTRGGAGPWPDETDADYRDAMIDGDRCDRTPLDALMRILQQRRLIASAVTSSHDHRVVCFSARPIDQLLAARTFRSHLSRWDYEPFGVMIRRDAAEHAGMQSVIYGQPSDRDDLDEADRYRFHPVGRRNDWTAEQEWRAGGDVDLSCFDRDAVRVFALDRPTVRQRLSSINTEVLWVTDAVVGESDVDYVLTGDTPS